MGVCDHVPTLQTRKPRRREVENQPQVTQRGAEPEFSYSTGPGASVLVTPLTHAAGLPHVYDRPFPLTRGGTCISRTHTWRRSSPVHGP